MTPPALSPSSLSSKLSQYAYTGPGSPQTPRKSQARLRSQGVASSSPSKRLKRSHDQSAATCAPVVDDTKEEHKAEVESPQTQHGWKKPKGFAPPELYAHLPLLSDHLRPDLDLVFCGINPGKLSAKSGHHFAHPTNKFWRAVYQSGLTPRLLTPAEDASFPGEYGYGLTNLVPRPTSQQSELSPLEMRLSVAPFLSKVARNRPRVVCFVGKGIWDTFAGVAKRTACSPAPLAVTPVPAGPTTPVRQQVVQVKTEESSAARRVVKFSLEGGLVKEEPQVEVWSPSPSPSRKGPVKPKPPAFAWDEPQMLRLPLESVARPAASSPPHSEQAAPAKGTQWTHTYFWVVPSTSGLERTTLPEQAVRFSNLRTFVQSLKRGETPEGPFMDIDLDGVEQTVEEMRESARARGQLV